MASLPQHGEPKTARGFGTGAGRPLTYDATWGAKLCDYMEEHSASLREAAHALGVPLVSAHSAVTRDPDVEARYRGLQAALAEEWEGRSVSAAEEGWAKVLDETTDAKRANAVASAARTLSERYAWRAKVADPARYGDAVRHTGTLRHEHAVVMLPPLAPLAPPDRQVSGAQSEGPQRVSATARLALGDGGALGDASAPERAGAPDRAGSGGDAPAR